MWGKWDGGGRSVGRAGGRAVGRAGGRAGSLAKVGSTSAAQSALGREDRGESSNRDPPVVLCLAAIEMRVLDAFLVAAASGQWAAMRLAVALVTDPVTNGAVDADESEIERERRKWSTFAHDGCTQSQLAHACYRSTCSASLPTGMVRQLCTHAALFCDECQSICARSDCALRCVCSPGEPTVLDPRRDGTFRTIFGDRREEVTIYSQARVGFVFSISGHGLLRRDCNNLAGGS